MRVKIRSIRALIRKELVGYFDSPTAYVLLVVWSAAAAYFFFRVAFAGGEASLRPLFELLPWLLLFFVPAATMRSLAAERKDGTLEVLLSHPLSEAEVIAGKLAANVIFILIALALTLPIAAGLTLGGRLDLGMVAGEYLGAAFLIIGLASVGLFASSLSRNQTVAFIISLAVTFALLATGLEFVIMALPTYLVGAARGVSALAHFASMTRGVLSLGDVAYFAALTAAFSALSYFGLRREREARHSARYKNLRLGTALILIVAVLAGLIGTAVGGRLDLTSGRLYSLSGATVETLRGLPDNVTIKLYASKALPPEVETSFRDIKDTILDYQTFGNGRVKAIVKSPADGPQGQQEIQSAGIRLVQFNVVSQDEYKVKQGYLGLTVEYKNKKEAIPFIDKTGDLEYQLTRMIRKMSRTKRKKVAFLGGHEGRTEAPAAEQGAGPDNWRRLIGEEYDVTDVKIEPGRQIPADVGTVVIFGPKTAATKDEVKALSAFLRRGGSVLALIDALEVDTNMMTVKPNEGDFKAFLAKYGLAVEPKLLFDLRANQMINAGGPGNNFLMPYPFWMRVGPASENTIVRDVGAVTFPWGQPVRSIRRGQKLTPLLATSQFAGAQTKNFSIAPDPDMTVGREKLARRVVAAARRLPGGGRLIVVGDSDFLTDRFIGAPQSQNAVFGLNAVDWLSQDASLARIRSKGNQVRPLVFPSEAVRDLVRYLNLIGVPLAVAAFGALRLARRRRLTRQVFEAA